MCASSRVQSSGYPYKRMVMKVFIISISQEVRKGIRFKKIFSVKQKDNVYVEIVKVKLNFYSYKDGQLLPALQIQFMYPFISFSSFCSSFNNKKPALLSTLSFSFANSLEVKNMSQDNERDICT